jgi:hypothetical protein
MPSYAPELLSFRTSAIYPNASAVTVITCPASLLECGEVFSPEVDRAAAAVA